MKAQLRRPRRPELGEYADLFVRDPKSGHWAYEYADRLNDRVPADRRIVIQTSMSPSGPFHLGNFRDTACAHLVARALAKRGRKSLILLSFDDYDPVRPNQALRSAELHGTAGMAQGALARSASICHEYLDELRSLGLLTDDHTADDRAAPITWRVDYQYGRYRDNTYRIWQRRYLQGSSQVASLLNVPDSRRLFAVYCEQCQRNQTRILSLTPRVVRYSCRHCGAVWSTEDLGVVKPSWAVDWTLRVAHEGIDCEPAGQDHCSSGSTMDRTRAVFAGFLRRPQPLIVPYGLVREIGSDSKMSGSSGSGLRLAQLLSIMPPAMVLWLYTRTDCRRDISLGLGKDFLYRSYAEYDRFLQRVRAGERMACALHELITDEGVPHQLPSWRRIIGLLHSHYYDGAEVVAELAAGDDPHVVERVHHAKHWLANHGYRHTWVSRVADDSSPLTAWPQKWTRADHAALSAALFGTVDGPPLRRLIADFGIPRLRELAAAGGGVLRPTITGNLGDQQPAQVVSRAG